MSTKTCSRCKSAKPTTEFTKDASRKDGLSYRCKPCDGEYSIQKRKANPAADRARVAKYRSLHVEEVRERARLAMQSKRREGSEAFVASRRRQHADRRATKLQASVAWANKDAMTEIYSIATAWNEIWPDDIVHVDHVVPLKSKLVCGLHNEHNLRIIRAFDNMSKKNCHWPDMP